ncbi:MAG TPA: hypothetical protein VLF87_03225 [Patescibacteria group bacterium]|nr:hypothetical protein [Patescibacteria group bacterium]
MLHPNIVEAATLTDRVGIEAEAWNLIQTREHFDGVEMEQQEYHDNARTALMEALTAAGHLSRIEITGTIEDINRQVLSRLLKGWDDSLPVHEKERRFLEICEELTIQRLHSLMIEGRVSKSLQVGLISDYPLALDAKTATTLGYRFKNKKGMVRTTSLRDNEDGTYTRIIEQVSRSNGTQQSSHAFLNDSGIRFGLEKSPDLMVMATPFVFSQEDYVDGVVDIQRRLDTYGGPGVLYGDTGESAALHPAYENIRTESAAREGRIEAYIEGLSKLERKLNDFVNDGQLSRHERTAIFGEEVDRILSAICLLEPEYVKATYGDRMVPIFEQASQLYVQGHQAEALQLLAMNNQLKDVIVFCGMAISLERAKEMGLEVNGLGELVEKGKESWKWKQGVCRVQACPSRPGKTKVGPCEVCEKCQTKFDRGEDPTKRAKLDLQWLIPKAEEKTAA